MSKRITATQEWVQGGLLVLLIFLIPLQTRYLFTNPLVGGAPWEDGRIALYGFDIVFLFLLTQAQTVWKNTQDFRWITFVLFWVAMLLSIVHVERMDLSVYRLIRVAEAMFVFGLLVRVSRRWLHAAMATWVVAGIIQACVALTQFVMQSFPANKWFGLSGLDAAALGTSVVENAGGRFLRAYGMFPHPNILAGFLVIGVVIALKLYGETTSSRVRMLAAVGMIMQQFGLFLTLSRTGVVALGVAVFVMVSYALYSWGKDSPLRSIQAMRRAPVILVVMVLFWIGMGVSLRELWVPRVAIDTQFEERSLSEREHLLVDAVEVWNQSEWFGVGVGNMTVALQGTHPEWNGYQLQPPHNVPLLILAETGVVGFVVGAMMLAGFLWKTIQQRPVMFVSMGGIFAMFMLGILDHYFWTQGSGMLMFWAALGIFQPRADVASKANNS